MLARQEEVTEKIYRLIFEVCLCSLKVDYQNMLKKLKKMILKILKFVLLFFTSLG